MAIISIIFCVNIILVASAAELAADVNQKEMPIVKDETNDGEQTLINREEEKIKCNKINLHSKNLNMNFRYRLTHS